MHSRSTTIVAAARRCVGTRFRPQGRAPGIGLDCIGVALFAGAAAGARFTVPRYALGGDGQDALDTALPEQGCTPVGLPRPGDLILVAPASGRRHLGIVTDAGIIHAHAGLNRVVEGPLDPAWRRLGAWRFPEPQE